jgi:5-methylcytosine-specific restriction enzyme A
MKQPDVDLLAAVLGSRFGLDLSGRIGKKPEGEYYSFHPADFDEQESFSVTVQLGWRSVNAAFIPGSYSAELVVEMGRASAEKQSVFKSLAKKVLEDGGRIEMRVNGENASPTATEVWPQWWQNVTLSIERSPLLIEPTDKHQKELVLTWGGTLLGMVVALLPLEEEQLTSVEPVGLPEGAKTRVEVNRYERNPLNRAACIQAWGPVCRICNFDFGKTYGPAGQGYIHVHHVTPVSALGEGYLIDPITDLAPVCPNCHAIIHRSDPPYSLDQVRTLLQKAKAAAGDGSSSA